MGEASKSNLIDFEIGKIVFIIKGLILLIGFPNNKYHPNTKNYLPFLVIGKTFSIRRKGLYTCSTARFYTSGRALGQAFQISQTVDVFVEIKFRRYQMT